MKDFSVYIPTRLFFGPGHADNFAAAVAKLGRKALLVTGGGSIHKLGYFEYVAAALNKAGVAIVEFSGIEANPLAQTINRAAKEHMNSGIEVVIPLGGGSVMDASKGISALLHDRESDVWEFVLGSPRHSQLKGALPIAAIPTTAATASEVTPYSVISNKDVSGKSVLAYEFFKPLISWLNPEFTTKLTPTTTQDGASDILSHVFENYLLGGNDSPMADRYSEGIMRSVMSSLPAVLKDLSDVHHRGILLWCSSLALNGIHLAGRNPSEFVLHSIEHAMSGYHHELAHGRGLATLYPAYFRWLWQKERARDRMARLGVELFGLPAADANTGLNFIEKFEGWLKENQLLQSANQIGIPNSAFKQIAEYAVKIYGGNIQLNALGAMGVEDIVEVLELTESQRIGQK